MAFWNDISSDELLKGIAYYYNVVRSEISGEEEQVSQESIPEINSSNLGEEVYLYDDQGNIVGVEREDIFGGQSVPASEYFAEMQSSEDSSCLCTSEDTSKQTEQVANNFREEAIPVKEEVAVQVLPESNGHKEEAMPEAQASYSEDNSEVPEAVKAPEVADAAPVKEEAPPVETEEEDTTDGSVVVLGQTDIPLLSTEISLAPTKEISVEPKPREAAEKGLIAFLSGLFAQDPASDRQAHVVARDGGMVSIEEALAIQNGVRQSQQIGGAIVEEGKQRTERVSIEGERVGAGAQEVVLMREQEGSVVERIIAGLEDVLGSSSGGTERSNRSSNAFGNRSDAAAVFGNDSGGAGFEVVHGAAFVGAPVSAQASSDAGDLKSKNAFDAQGGKERARQYARVTEAKEQGNSSNREHNGENGALSSDEVGLG